mgnify:CR=1 FL=1|jgi:hypothetical protein
MNKNSNGYKIKDFVLLGIVTAIYFVLYMVIGFATAGLNPLLHAFSPAVFSLVGGTVVLFLMYKVPKFGILTLQTLLLFALVTVIGMGYLPWFISSVVCAVLADLIAASSSYKSTWKNGVGYGLMQVGSSAGGIIPAMFFAEGYKAEWTARGMTAEQMDASIAVSTGVIGVVVLVVTFIAGFIGILIAQKILAKHFK